MSTWHILCFNGHILINIHLAFVFNEVSLSTLFISPQNRLKYEVKVGIRDEERGFLYLNIPPQSYQTLVYWWYAFPGILPSSLLLNIWRNEEEEKTGRKDPTFHFNKFFTFPFTLLLWRSWLKKKWYLHIFNLLPNCSYPRLFIILWQNNHNKSKAITSSNRICRSIEIPRSRVSYEIYFIILFVISIFSFLPSPHLFPCWTYKQNVLFSPKTRRVTSFIHLFIYILCILFASHLCLPSYVFV